MITGAGEAIMLLTGGNSSNNVASLSGKKKYNMITPKNKKVLNNSTKASKENKGTSFALDMPTLLSTYSLPPAHKLIIDNGICRTSSDYNPVDDFEEGAMDLPKDEMQMSVHRNLLQNLLVACDTNSNMVPFYGESTVEGGNISALRELLAAMDPSNSNNAIASSSKKKNAVKKKRSSPPAAHSSSVFVTEGPSKNKRIRVDPNMMMDDDNAHGSSGAGNNGAGDSGAHILSLLAAAANYVSVEE